MSLGLRKLKPEKLPSTEYFEPKGVQSIKSIISFLPPPLSKPRLSKLAFPLSENILADPTAFQKTSFSGFSEVQLPQSQIAISHPNKHISSLPKPWLNPGWGKCDDWILAHSFSNCAPRSAPGSQKGQGMRRTLGGHSTALGLSSSLGC